jgi:menaquinol-cytochrome c reductase iron-sulfur subunit
MTRRFFTGLVVAGGSAVLAGIVGIPALILSFSPILKRAPGERWRRVGKLDEFSLGTVQQAQLEVDRRDWPRSAPSQAVFVLRQTPDRVVVFSRSCTDLGCPLDYDVGSACFFCPCHGGIFGQDGEPLAGPTKQPMYRFAHRIRDDVLEIDVASLPPGV